MTIKDITTTKLYKSNTSVITSIPKTVLELENIDMKEKNYLKWSYYIKNNKIIYEVEFISEK